MPGKDGTGPLGQGPMTGRGAGNYAGTEIPESGIMPQGRGRGRGFGRGMCRGLGWMGAVAAGGLLDHTLFSTATKADEKTVLTEQAATMEKALADIKQRLNELEGNE